MKVLSDEDILANMRNFKLNYTRIMNFCEIEIKKFTWTEIVEILKRNKN